MPGFKCLLSVSGFTRPAIQLSFPPIALLTEPKTFVHGNLRSPLIEDIDWPGCP
eukprot:Gb_05824 [translate_table: standard]